MQDMREAETFSQILESEVSQRVIDSSLDDSGSFREEVFSEHVADILSELGETEDMTVCFYEHKTGKGNVRVNGYYVNDSTNKATLLTTIYLPDPLGSVPKRDIEHAVRCAVRLFEIADIDYCSAMEPATSAYDMLEHLAESSDEISDLDVVVITNGIVSSLPEEIQLPSLKPRIRWHVWDVVRLSRCQASERSYESIVINLEEMPSGALPCLKMPNEGADYDAYLTIMPGELLFQLYDEYGPKLLELNVRSYLQARGKVNRGIRDTIQREPERFLAYNNGISATAENVEIKGNGSSAMEIVRLEGFQVVNGGQTMASIHRARKLDQADISQVFLQAKITVVETELINELVPKISRFSNTQNKVNEADFSSNDPFHVETERLSEKIWCPGEQTRWFYERARGQYQVARNKVGTTAARRKKFDAITPSSQKFDKTGLAKYINAYDQIPHIVSLGNQKNFVHFMAELQKAGPEWKPDEKYYKELIGKAIIFKKAEKIARLHKFPAYRANAVTYTVALLSYRTVRRINLQAIWENQEVSDALAETLYDWMPVIYEWIIESAGERNVTEWCKKEECWRNVQTLDLDIPDDLQGELAEGQPLPTVGSERGQRGEGLSHVDRENIAKSMQVSSEAWMRIHVWAEGYYSQPAMPGISLSLAGYAASSWQKVPSAKQARQAVKMIDEANEDGLFGEQEADI